MRLLLVALAALALTACGEGAALDRLAVAGRGRVVEVISGDMVILDDGEAVKLAGIAAPRVGDPYGRQARALLDGLVLGREVELLSGGAKADPFGRRLAHLRRVEGRLWVQGAVLEAGAARVRTFADNRALAGEMLGREAKARVAERGLWALSDYRVALPGEVRGGGFTIVEGRVRAVRRYGDGFELDLEGLSAEIPGRAVRDFEAAGTPMAALAGQLVRVRGSVRGGTLRLDHPEAVEVLRAP